MVTVTVQGKKKKDYRMRSNSRRTEERMDSRIFRRNWGSIYGNGTY